MTDSESRRILLANDKRVKDVMRSLRAAIKSAGESSERAVDAIDIDTSFERQSGVVTQSKLTQAVHLISAKLIFHIVPNHWKQMLLGVVSNYVTAVAGKAAIVRAAGKIPGAGTMIQIFQGAFSIPSRLLFQAKLERDIRAACAGVRRDLNIKAPVGKRRKKTRDVMTRKFRPRLKRRFKALKSK